MKLLLILLFPLLSHAHFVIGYGTGGFTGQNQIQAGWISENAKNQLIASIGHTQDEEINSIWQASVAYMREVLRVNFQNFSWSPLLVGGFVTYTNHDLFYFDAPSKYEDPDYYDAANLRWGIRLGTELTLKRKTEKSIHFILSGSLLDRAIIAYYNNPSEPEILEAFTSLGVAVRMDF